MKRVLGTPVFKLDFGQLRAYSTSAVQPCIIETVINHAGGVSPARTCRGAS
jgi:hypothetical protein